MKKQHNPFTQKIETIAISEDQAKKLVMVSILDADDDAVEELGRTLTEGGFTENYQFLISGSPIQTIDPISLIEQFSHIYNVQQDGDPNNTGLTRTELFRMLFHHVTQITNSMIHYMKTNEDNVRLLATMISSLSVERGSSPILLADQETNIEKIKHHHNSLKAEGPKEGVKF
ncbi:hypothetical protein ACK8P5_26140 (plasmid) [Paenibacillus sp. EC2-1]|uniref:hypothetical protein n=1 Tax=Paenibacillus sp. EC2-1 TaxID=3388665 RepID=UPI003BEF1EB5